MRLYFVRHGESEANVLRHISNRGWVHGLTEKGRAQAAALAENLHGAGVSRIYTSPLKRAVETAEVLSQALGISYQVTGALREFDCGIAEDRPDEAAWALHHWVWEEWANHRYDSRIEDGESWWDIESRFGPFIEGLVAEKQETGESLALIGHGGLYYTMLPHLLANYPKDASEIGMPNTGYVLVEPRPEGLVCLEWCGVKIV